MASAAVVLKHETSILRQRHNFKSIDFKFGVSDYVIEITSPAEFGSDPMSGRDARRGQHVRDRDFFFIYFVFYNRATADIREPIFAHNSLNHAFW